MEFWWHIYYKFVKNCDWAAEKDVLFVHAAGNDGENMDVIESYPNDFKDGQEIASNFIKIGALNYTYGSKLSAGFSNYGHIWCRNNKNKKISGNVIILFLWWDW